MKRGKKPNISCRCRFYKYGVVVKDSEPVTNDYGELKQEFSLVALGLFAKERLSRASEAEEGDRTIGEQKYTLTGRYTSSLSKVSTGLYCYILSERKLYAVNGNATDPYGDKQWIWIDIVDNVTQDIASKFPGAPV
jgi:hypothetical protein